MNIIEYSVFRPRLFAFLCYAGSASLPLLSSTQPVAHRPPWNKHVLRIIETMPDGGRYGVSRSALNGLSKAIRIREGQLGVDPRVAKPSFCSGATYLVFVTLLEDLIDTGQLEMTDLEIRRLAVRGQRDGIGVWGRWNANGPGVARLFHECGLGRNFESLDSASPGDFMKVFWTDEIGAKEFGHLVVYLGRGKCADGTETIRFWSSNQPDGYGVKTVPLSKIRWAVFSRLLHPERAKQLPALDSVDTVSEAMLTRSFTREEVRHLTGIAPPVAGASSSRVADPQPVPHPPGSPEAIPPEGRYPRALVVPPLRDCNGRPDAPDSPTSVSPPGRKAPDSRIDTGEATVEYLVRSGDTLTEIATRHGTTLTRLCELNGIRDRDRIEAGWILKVPARRTHPARSKKNDAIGDG